MSEDFPTLFGDRYAPVTSALGFLEVPFDQAVEALHGWRSRLQDSVGVQYLEGGLEENVMRLEPLTGGVRPRELLVGTANREWTALFDCGVQGGDPVSKVGHLSQEIGCRGIVVVSIPDRPVQPSMPPRYGALQLEIFGPLRTHFLNYVRTVSLVREESRWRFDANGVVQAFEDTEAYLERRVRDRFTGKMLVRYAHELGLEPFSGDFYPGPSALLTTPVVPPSNAKVLTIEETQRWRGIIPEV